MHTFFPSWYEWLIKLRFYCVNWVGVCNSKDSFLFQHDHLDWLPLLSHCNDCQFVRVSNNPTSHRPCGGLTCKYNSDYSLFHFVHTGRSSSSRREMLHCLDTMLQVHVARQSSAGNDRDSVIMSSCLIFIEYIQYVRWWGDKVPSLSGDSNSGYFSCFIWSFLNLFIFQIYIYNHKVSPLTLEKWNIKLLKYWWQTFLQTLWK